MKKVIGIIVGLAVLAGLAGAGYYLFNVSTGASENMTIEDVGDVETEIVGNVYQPNYYNSDGNKDGKKLFDLMEDNEGAFFFVDMTEEPPDEGWPVVMGNKGEVAKAIGLVAADEMDTMMNTIGVGVEGFLNQDAEGMQEWDACKRRKGMFPSGLGYDLRQAESCLKHAFDGESPDKYFSDRELSIKCEDISAEKVAFFQEDNPDLRQLFIIYNAKVRTESCKGDSFFPPEGETGDMKIMVGAWVGNQAVTSYEYLLLR